MASIQDILAAFLDDRGEGAFGPSAEKPRRQGSGNPVRQFDNTMYTTPSRPERSSVRQLQNRRPDKGREQYEAAGGTDQLGTPLGTYLPNSGSTSDQARATEFGTDVLTERNRQLRNGAAEAMIPILMEQFLQMEQSKGGTPYLQPTPITSQRFGNSPAAMAAQALALAPYSGRSESWDPMQGELQQSLTKLINSGAVRYENDMRPAPEAFGLIDANPNLPTDPYSLENATQRIVDNYNRLGVLFREPIIGNVSRGSHPYYAANPTQRMGYRGGY
jgi:hypothetical protein